MLNIGTKYIDTIYFRVSLYSYLCTQHSKIPILYPISYKFKWNLLPAAGNVINYMHLSNIIDILYNWTNFMSNISFIFKCIMDWMNKDDILKII